jgi:hypothetical protein
LKRPPQVFLGILDSLVFFPVSSALTPEGSPPHPLDTAAMDPLDDVGNNSNRRITNKEYRISK